MHEAPTQEFLVSWMNLCQPVWEFQIEWKVGKPEYLQKYLSEQGTEPTTNPAYILELTLGFEPRPH